MNQSYPVSKFVNKKFHFQKLFPKVRKKSGSIEGECELSLMPVKYLIVINDVVQVLTESSNPSDYIKKMRKRDEQLSKGRGQIVTPLLDEEYLTLKKLKLNCEFI